MMNIMCCQSNVDELRVCRWEAIKQVTLIRPLRSAYLPPMTTHPLMETIDLGAGLGMAYSAI